MDHRSACKRSSSSNPLRGLGEELLTIVWESSSSEQLGSWLRVPLEHAAAAAAAAAAPEHRCNDSSSALCLKLLEAGADAFVRRGPVLDRSPLLAAAQAGNAAVVSALLDNGSAPDGEEEEDCWEASIFSSSSSAITVGTGNAWGVVDASSSYRGRRTPLHFAASGGHVSMVRALIGAGADLDTADGDGCTPLHLAVFRGFEEVVQELVDAGASVDTSDSEGETPLHTASAHGSLGMVKAILRGSRESNLPCPTDHLEMPPLHRAALGGHCEVMSELLRQGSSLHTLAGNARTALHAAAMSGSGAAVRFMLDRDISSLEARDHDGRTALHLASGHRLGSDETLRALVESGGNIEARTFLGETPLHKACKALRVSAVEQLLRFGANDAAVDAEGRTPAAMTARLLQSQRPGMFRDMLQNILTLLEAAPGDRVWRRRGWLLMLRRVGSSTATEPGSCHEKGVVAGARATPAGTRAIPGLFGAEKEAYEHKARPRKVGKAGDAAVARATRKAAGGKREHHHHHPWCYQSTTEAAGVWSGVDSAAAKFCRDEAGGDRELRSVVERAVDVDEGGVFRNIVAFL